MKVFLLCLFLICLMVVVVLCSEDLQKKRDPSRRPIPRPKLEEKIGEILSTDFKPCPIGTKCSPSDPNSCANCLEGQFSCVHLSADLYEVDDSTRKLKKTPTLYKNARADEGYCLPSERPNCNPFTGDRVLAFIREKWQFGCKCKYPSLVNQADFHSDCDLVKACKPSGQLKLSKDNKIDFDPFLHGICDCEQNYKHSRSNVYGPECLSMNQGDVSPCHPGNLSTDGSSCICPPGYVDSGNTLAYNEKEMGKLFPKRRCLKAPCVWDPKDLTQTVPHNENLYVKGYGCVCDYRNGHVGILYEKDNTLVNARGYSACVKVADIPRGQDHKTTTHFFHPSRKTYTRHHYWAPYLVKWVRDGLKDKTKPLIVLERHEVTGKFSYLSKILRDRNFKYTYMGTLYERDRPGWNHEFNRDLTYEGSKIVTLVPCHWDIDPLNYHHALCYCGKSVRDMKVNFEEDSSSKYRNEGDFIESVIAWPTHMKRIKKGGYEVTYTDDEIIVRDGADNLSGAIQFPSTSSCYGHIKDINDFHKTVINILQPQVAPGNTKKAILDSTTKAILDSTKTIVDVLQPQVAPKTKNTKN